MEAPRPSPRQLSSVYGEAYYRGDFGSYGPGGYATHHPNWEDWLDLIQYFQPGGTLLDLGCAYGYLVAAARKRGYRAFGLDVSSYALLQSPETRRHCVQGDLAGLPWPTGFAEVVCLFDVIEHLPDPVAALRECRRVLAPGGLLVLTTPDPLHFDRDDPTHLAERPPSFWLARLEELELAAAFRFSVVPYNFQVLAAPRGSRVAERLSHFGHDFLGPHTDFLTPAEGLDVVPRSGWGPPRDGRRELRRDRGLLYLRLPEGQGSFRVRVTGRVTAEEPPVCLRFSVDCLPMQEIFLTPAKSTAPVDFAVTLPPGGHELAVEPDPFRLGILVSELRITAGPAAPADPPTCLTPREILRAEATSKVSRILRPTSVLDASGISDRAGYPAASPRDAWCRPGTAAAAPRILFLGPRQIDHPLHLPWDGGVTTRTLPAASFDLVVCLDPAAYAEPEALLEELDRLAARWLLWGVAAAEAKVPPPPGAAAGERDRHGSESDRRGTEAVRAFFAGRGYQVWNIPGPPLTPGGAELDELLPRLPPELRERLRAAWLALCRNCVQDVEPWLLVAKEPGSLSPDMLEELGVRSEP